MTAIAPSRALWTRVEPIHALTYFAPEARAAFEACGLRGFWRGYFGGRAAPLGATQPGLVTATFYGFHPDFVARAVPSIWELATPAAALAARLEGVEPVLARVGSGLDLAVAIDVLRRAVDRCDPAGRPLFAANADLPWPTEPHLALWHACTLLREHRGDGHVIALASAGIDGCESHVLRVAATGIDPAVIQPHRGWSDDDWAAATDRLRSRDQLDAATHAAIEDHTDRLSVGLDDPDDQRALDAITAAIVAADVIPYPNAVGVPRVDD